MDDPLDGVPAELVTYLAQQLDIADPSCVRSYGEREKTRFEHLWEIRAADRWREFAEVEDELDEWIGGRAWTTGGRPEGAVRRKRGRATGTPRAAARCDYPGSAGRQPP
ncbi:MAG TPA: DUF4158 domain-containing protein [Pseudonocardiaceae bacterium]|nr:DUF4158 domain-containing protein [Pseudonocardiaceae bacterium]